MKELNLIENNVSFVIEGKNILVTEPTMYQNEILKCENSIEIINKKIDKTTAKIKENQRQIYKYKGKSLPTIIGFTVIGYIIGIIIKLITGTDTISLLDNIDISLFSTISTIPLSVYAITIITSLKNACTKENQTLRKQNSGYKELLKVKETELAVLKMFDSKIDLKNDVVAFSQEDNRKTIEQLKIIRDFYSTETKSENEFIGMSLDNGGILMLKKTKNKSKN